MTTLAPGTVVEIRPQGFVKGVMVVKGPKGDPGADGIDGADGGPGPANTLTIGTVTTSAAGGSAAATLTGTSPAQTLNLTIPRGAAGPTTNLAIGTVTTGAPGTNASATISGTAPSLTLDMTIPRGAPGTGNVNTVNGYTGPDITLAASDVHARPDTYVPAWTEVTGKPSTFAPSAHTHAESEITGLTADLAAKIATSSKGVANGVASLDSAGKVPVTQLPASVMEYQGVWNASTNTPTLADGTGNSGDQYRVTVAGTRNLGSGSQTFAVGDFVIYDGSAWQLAHGGADAVQSVAGLTGTITSAGLKTALAIAQSDVSGLTTSLSGKQDTSAKGAANGYASLGADGKVPSAQLPTSSSTPLARVVYSPTTQTTVSTTSATASDLDATNLAVTFTAPASGTVRVVLEALAQGNSGTFIKWLLREGTTALMATERLALVSPAGLTPIRIRTEIVITGLTSGSSHTYKWAHRSPSQSTISTVFGGPAPTDGGTTTTHSGPAIMEVWAE